MTSKFYEAPLLLYMQLENWLCGNFTFLTLFKMLHIWKLRKPILIFTLNFFFHVFFLCFIFLKRGQRQYCPGNRFNRYFRDKIIKIFKDKTGGGAQQHRKLHERKKRREGSTGDDEDKVPGHINTKKGKKTKHYLEHFVFFKYITYTCTKLYNWYSKVVTTQRQLPQKSRVRLRKILWENRKERTENNGEKVFSLKANCL